MTPHFDNVLDLLEAGATVVTPTRRLAQALRRAYDQRQEATGQAAWPSPDALSWSAWQQREWQAAQFVSPLPVALDAQQELAAWARAIDASPQSAHLLDCESVAAEALEAWTIICAYRLAPRLARATHTDETRAFLGWRDAFLQFCSEHRLIDGARLPDELAHQFTAGNLRAPRRFVLFGFDAIDPQRAALIEALRAAGSDVAVLTGQGARGDSAVVVHAGAEHEIHAAAAWARRILEASPDARIGVVVPDLDAQRATIARVFDDVLQPDSVLDPAGVRPRPWNLSLGRPLADWPVVHAALMVLELPEGRLPAPRTGMLLRSPFVGDAETERMPRALLDARLCDLREPYVDLQLLEHEARRESRLHACPLLLDRLWKLQRRAREAAHQHRPPSAWGPHLQSLLAAMGWPGQRTLDSEEHQAVEAWRELIASLARFDPILGAIAYSSALQLVRRLAADRLFQPETPEVPVQILGVLESAGLQFDHLMVLGLHGEAWPRPARPNPLLAVEVQRHAQVPRSAPEWELAFARRTMQGWLHAARQVLFTYPAAEEDRTLQPSPLLADLPRGEAATTAEDFRSVIYGSRRVERCEDNAVRALPPGVRTSGGASVFQDQAACSFRAFAAHRLGAEHIEHPGEGLDARERGTLVHAALAQFWTATQDHATLTACSEAQLDERVRDAVDRALADFAPRRPSLFQSRLIDLERVRLVRLLHEWLDVDRNRPPFAVLPPEQAQDVQIGGLRMRVRLDRVDRMPDAREVLIDYKTGDASAQPRRWFGERPDEPQLPAYALARSQPPAALAFGIVKRGKCKLQGLAQAAAFGAGIEALDAAKLEHKAGDWAGQVAAWSSTLEALGARFRGTEVRVDPKVYPNTCRNCTFGSLCRVGELLGTAEAEADEAD
jgi:probable DNA repair protein